MQQLLLLLLLLLCVIMGTHNCCPLLSPVT
jgi:hypothetical protein